MSIEMWPEFGLVVIIGIGIAAIVGIWIFNLGINNGRERTNTIWREAAVKSGDAEWVINEKTGETKFQWKRKDK